METRKDTYTLTDSGSVSTQALAVGVIGILGSGIALYADRAHFFHAYLVAFSFFTTISLGALVFVMIQHLVYAEWSIVLRRIAECLAFALPMLALFFIPIGFGMHDLYHWSHPDAMAHDALLKGKEPYLNTTFFVIRTVIYFTIWSVLAWWLYTRSVEQDSGYDETRNENLVRYSAPGTLLFALSITFAAFDWLMSLDPHWYSTIFGVYVFAGSWLTMFAVITIIAVGLRTSGILTDTIRINHYHDLGRLMFGFTVFWTYIAFSQYFLIWYGNIPEETIFFLRRWENGWSFWSLLLVFGHFFLPFVLLITRSAKRNLLILNGTAILIVFMHWVDMYWLVMPNHGAFQLSWIDLMPMLGIGGMFVWFFWQRLIANAIVPISDPRLQVSITYTN